jgi:hypothetical protein
MIIIIIIIIIIISIISIRCDNSVDVLVVQLDEVGENGGDEVLSEVLVAGHADVLVAIQDEILLAGADVEVRHFHFANLGDELAHPPVLPYVLLYSTTIYIPIIIASIHLI